MTKITNETILDNGKLITSGIINFHFFLNLFECESKGKNRSIGPELMTAKTGPIHLSSFVEIAFVDWFTKLLLINISMYMNI